MRNIHNKVQKSTKTVIFDGDGTLWRPIGTSEHERPDSIYRNKGLEGNILDRLGLVTGVRQILKELQTRGVKIFVVSAHPTPGPEALAELGSKISNLGIDNLIDGYFCSDGANKDDKTRVIQDIIKNSSIDPKNTYMVGDSYYYDYVAGVNAGVNSFFIKNDYCKQPSPLPKQVRAINSVADLIVI